MKILIETDEGDPVQRIERDNELLQQLSQSASGQRAILRCWINSQCLVVGRQVTRWEGFEQAAQIMSQCGWPVIVRATGGTVVPHYAGVLNVSFIYSVTTENRSFASAYQALCRPLIAAFKAYGLEVDTGPVAGSYCDGEYNIRIKGRKLVGTAQRRKRPQHQPGAQHETILVHACINTAEAGEGVSAVQNFLSHLGDDRQAVRVKHEAHTDLQAELGAIDTRFELHCLLDHIVTCFSSASR